MSIPFVFTGRMFKQSENGFPNPACFGYDMRIRPIWAVMEFMGKKKLPNFI